MKLHFIAGLPRSGSTLLSALLNQNPRFKASMTSPLAEVFTATLHSMSLGEGSLFITNNQREAILRSLVNSYYHEVEPDRVVFDTARPWCALAPTLAQLFPSSRIVCCVRSPAWIMDSVERLVQSNPLLVSKMFSRAAGMNVYTRVEELRSLFVGHPLNCFKQAWYGEHAERLIAIRYDSLVNSPAAAMCKLYEALSEPGFSHDFEHIEYDEPAFDNSWNMPGLHRIRGPVKARQRASILPPDLFSQFDQCFWNEPGNNPRNVTVI